MLSDSLFDTHEELKEALDHYTKGTFEDYYSNHLVDEVKLVLNRIDELRSYIDGAIALKGEAKFTRFLILSRDSFNSKTTSKDDFVLINTNASRIVVESTLNKMINRDEYYHLDAIKDKLKEKQYFCQILLFDITDKRNVIDINNLV